MLLPSFLPSLLLLLLLLLLIPGQGGGRGNSNKDSEGSSSNITQGGETYWGDNSYGRGADGRNRTSDGWQNGVSGAHGICIVYSF